MAIQAATLEVHFQEKGSDAVVGAINRVDSAIQTTSSGFDALYDSVSSFASRALDGINQLADGIGKIGVAGLATIFAKGAKASWDMVDSVEQATIALNAYETDARKVEAVLEDLLAFARSDAGRLFMRQELFQMATAMRVAGAETENLNRYTQILSRSVASGMSTWNDLERVITRVGSTGRLTTIEFELLQQAGFQLDESLRNTTVSWEELFDALDRGSTIIEGQTETIQGRMIQLQTAIRGVGVALLDIDSETSRFREGGLGDLIMSGLEAAPALLAHVADGARMLGEAISGLVAAFQMLPGWLQGAIGGIVGVIAAFGTLRQAIALTRTAMNALGLGAFTRMFSPLGLAITGVALVGGHLVRSFMEQKQAAEDYKQSVTDLEAELERLRRQGDDTLADLGQGFLDATENLDTRMDELRREWSDIDAYFDTRAMEEFGREFDRFDVEMIQAAERWTAEWREMQTAIRDFELPIEDITALRNLGREALGDPYVDAAAWLEWSTALLTSAESAEELRAAVDLILETPLSDFARGSASDIERMTSAFDGFLSMLGAVGEDPARGIESAADAVAYLDEAIATGSINIADFTRLRGELTRAVIEGSITEARAAEILMDYVDAAIAAEEAMHAFGETASDTFSTAIEQAQAAAEEVAELRDAFIEGLFEFANIDFAKQVNLAGLGTDATHAAQSINEVGSALDSVLAVYGQIDAMGNRMRAAGGIADALFGEGGDPADGVGPLRDVFDAGLISVEQFNSAIEDGIAIQKSAAESELYLNKIRADQLPILRQTTEAYNEQIKAIADIDDATAQMAAIGWMDTGMQDRVQQFTEMVSLMGRLGPQGAEAMQQMIDGIVATDPVLTAMLENLGLIEEKANGTYEINLDAAGAVSEIEMLNTTLGHLIDTLRGDELGTYEVTIKANLDLSALEGGAGWVGEGIGRAITIPVSADTGPAALELNAFEEDASTPITVPVEFDWGGAAGFVGGGIAGAFGAFDSGLEIEASVTVDTSGADGAIESVETNLAALDGSTASITVDGDAAGAMTAITTAATNLGMIDGQQANVSILGDASDAVAAVSEAATNLGMIDGSQAWIYIMGDNSHAAGVIQAMAAYNGMVLATAYVDVVARQIGSGQAIAQGIVAGARQGLGIHSPSREFAEIGKYTAMGFQQGWEREFENPSIGLSTAAAYSGYGVAASGTSSGSGGVHIAPNAVNITVHAETGADADEIAVAVADRITPALTTALTQRRAGFGGVQA